MCPIRDGDEFGPFQTFTAPDSGNKYRLRASPSSCLALDQKVESMVRQCNLGVNRWTEWLQWEVRRVDFTGELRIATITCIVESCQQV